MREVASNDLVLMVTNQLTSKVIHVTQSQLISPCTTYLTSAAVSYVSTIAQDAILVLTGDKAKYKAKLENDKENFSKQRDEVNKALEKAREDIIENPKTPENLGKYSELMKTHQKLSERIDKLYCEIHSKLGFTTYLNHNAK